MAETIESRMKIAFWLTSTTRMMTAENWGKAPMGGAEISAVNLGNELLKLGHDVTYYLQRAEPFDRFDLHVRQHEQIFDVDLGYFICVRPHEVLYRNLTYSKKVLWSGDAFDQSSNDIFWNQNIAESMDAFVFKSNWQRQKMLEKYFYIKPEKAHVIYNGINAEFFSKNGVVPQKNRFIHTSVWYRGLANFKTIWPLILEKIPDAEIHIFSKTSLYNGLNGHNMDGYYQIAEELCQLPGMILRDPVPQNILAQEMRKSWLMLYPNSGFVESSCGSALQAMSVGCPVIATKRAGLPETIRNGGMLIEEKEGWENEFAETVIDLCWKKEKRQKMSVYGSRITSSETWANKAMEWQDFLKSL